MSRRRTTAPLLVLAVVAVVLVTVGAVPAAARARHAPRRPDPVLLVHGFQGSASGWGAMTRYLRDHGYRPAEIDAIDYDSDASNIETARRIAREAAALRARTGASRIDVVSHSMGAISSRYFVERLGGAAHVDAWVSLAGVNEGTVWAYGCYLIAPCREMVPTSSVLQRLNDSFRPTATTRYGAVVVTVRRRHRAPGQRRARGRAQRGDRVPGPLGAEVRPARARSGRPLPRPPDARRLNATPGTPLALHPGRKIG